MEEKEKRAMGDDKKYKRYYIKNRKPYKMQFKSSFRIPTPNGV
jgi:hypothetical protein